MMWRLIKDLKFKSHDTQYKTNQLHENQLFTTIKPISKTSNVRDCTHGIVFESNSQTLKTMSMHPNVYNAKQTT